MAYKALIFGTDEAYKKLKPFYETAVKRGDFEIVARSKMEGDNVNDFNDFDFVIISPIRDFYQQMKQLESKGVQRDKIIDGRVFWMPNLDFPRFLGERIAYGVLDKNIFDANSRMIYPQIYKTKNGKTTLSLGKKSYIRNNSAFEGSGLISLGNFCSFAPKIFFSVGQNRSHNYRNVGMIPLSNLDWAFPRSFWPTRGTCKILVGSDVWCGRGTIFKCTNPKKPLVIGDGAVIASDSVVVKDVPPYAIVGGNPAQIIKYRFPPDIIEAFLRIKWWDWDIDKIHDNYKYFNDVEKFISLHDK